LELLFELIEFLVEFVLDSACEVAGIGCSLDPILYDLAVGMVLVLVGIGILLFILRRSRDPDTDAEPETLTKQEISQAYVLAIPASGHHSIALIYVGLLGIEAHFYYEETKGSNLFEMTAGIEPFTWLMYFVCYSLLIALPISHLMWRVVAYRSLSIRFTFSITALLIAFSFLGGAPAANAIFFLFVTFIASVFIQGHALERISDLREQRADKNV
jgi:hypothetical protein